MPPRKCVWCRLPLRFEPGRGWVHEATGRIYATRIDSDGKERDDHCSLPDWSESGAVTEAMR
jgi:hypothetical protein